MKLGSRLNEGLYNVQNEHDACGVGMIVNIHGGKTHELVDAALKVLENTQSPDTQNSSFNHKDYI